MQLPMLGRLARALRKNVAPLVLALGMVGVGTMGASAYAAQKGAQDKWHILSVVGVKQEKSTWCGPAAGQILLSAFGITKRDVTQRQLANGMHTDGMISSFTWPGDIPTTLNIALVKWAKPRTKIRYTDYQHTGVNQLYTFAKKSVNEGAPVIITVKPSKLWWKDAPALEGHYLVIYGWNDAWYNPATKKTQKAYLVRDPADNSIHHLAAADWGAGKHAANAGYFNGDVIVPTNVV